MTKVRVSRSRVESGPVRQKFSRLPVVHTDAVVNHDSVGPLSKLDVLSHVSTTNALETALYIFVVSSALVVVPDPLFPRSRLLAPCFRLPVPSRGPIFVDVVISIGIWTDAAIQVIGRARQLYSRRARVYAKDDDDRARRSSGCG